MKNDMKKQVKLCELVFPNKKINYFVITVLVLGVLSGAIFLVMSSEVDRSSVIAQIENFFTNIANENIDNGLAIRNSLIINYLFVGCIFVFGLSMIGILLNIFLTYIKGFLVGFSIAAIFLTYSYKGIVAVLFYTIPVQIFNLFVVGALSIYSIMFSYKLLKIIIFKKGNNRLMLKKYFIILMFCVMISFISSLLEVYVFPKLLKLIISIYI